MQEKENTNEKTEIRVGGVGIWELVKSDFEFTSTNVAFGDLIRRNDGRIRIARL